MFLNLKFKMPQTPTQSLAELALSICQHSSMKSFKIIYNRIISSISISISNDIHIIRIGFRIRITNALMCSSF